MLVAGAIGSLVTLLKSIQHVVTSACWLRQSPAATPLWKAGHTESLVALWAWESLLSSTEDWVGYDLPDKHSAGIFRLSVNTGLWLHKVSIPLKLKWIDTWWLIVHHKGNTNYNSFLKLESFVTQCKTFISFHVEIIPNLQKPSGKRLASWKVVVITMKELIKK